jgi:predicted SprT family Zn-dependent metalloprotease
MTPSDAIEFAQELIIEYGLLGWRAELDRAVSRFGVCRYSRKLITLSNDLVQLNNQACVLDVILHEIAHALAGPRTGHGPEWKRIPYSRSVIPCHAASQMRKQLSLSAKEMAMKAYSEVS